MNEANISRARVLLTAAFTLLEKCEQSAYVTDPMGVTVFYDETDCDGSCLKDDIEHFLEWEFPKDPPHRRR